VRATPYTAMASLCSSHFAEMVRRDEPQRSSLACRARRGVQPSRDRHPPFAYTKMASPLFGSPAPRIGTVPRLSHALPVHSPNGYLRKRRGLTRPQAPSAAGEYPLRCASRSPSKISSALPLHDSSPPSHIDVLHHVSLGPRPGRISRQVMGVTEAAANLVQWVSPKSSLRSACCSPRCGYATDKSDFGDRWCW
jgi:hypothetical protein